MGVGRVQVAARLEREPASSSKKGGRTVAAASVLQRRLPHLPVAILYVPKGPALDWTDADLAGRVLAELERLARRRRALFVKIDPDVYYAGAAPSFSSRPACGLETARLLTATGLALFRRADPVPQHPAPRPDPL